RRGFPDALKKDVPWVPPKKNRGAMRWTQFPDDEALKMPSHYSLGDFREEIARQLCGFPDYGSPPENTTVKSPPSTLGDVTTVHIPVFSDTQRRCVVCYKEGFDLIAMPLNVKSICMSVRVGIVLQCFILRITTGRPRGPATQTSQFVTEHIPVQGEHKRNCVVCYKEGRGEVEVQTYCSAPQCEGKYMHVAKQRNCFAVFHSAEYHLPNP
ncbi:hypothetical protein pdam_00012204, partial [Pocillopora damicornis]